MYDAIRQLIRQNRLRKAIHDMGDLKLSREHASRLVSLDRRLHILENKKIANLSEDRLIVIEENGLVEDMLVFLDQVEFPQRRHTKAHHIDHQGAAAGTQQAPKKSMGKWIGIAAAIIALLAIGFLLWPDAPKASPVSEARVTAPTEQPSPSLTDAERKKEAQRLEDEKKKEDIRQQELLKERERQKRLAAAKKEQEAQNAAFMTSGKQLDITVAVYTGQASTTKPNADLTKNLDSYLRRFFNGKSIDAAALTKTFHYSKERELILFGRSGGEKRLLSHRARYVVLADVRNVSKEGKGDLRMCIYNTSTGKSLIRKESINVGTAPQMLDKYIIYAVRAFVGEEIKL
jgi:hypothetical protein